MRLLAALLVVCAVGWLAGAAAGRNALNAATYEDERAEEAGAPDIATVSVANDDRGELTLFVSVPSHPELTPDMRIRIWFSDGDPATGLEAAFGGFDHFVLVDAFLLGLGNAVFYDCDRTNTCFPADLRDASFTYARGASFTLPADAFGIEPEQWGSTRIDFFAVVGAGYGYEPETRTFDFTNARVDRAPSNDGHWTYLARVGPAALVAKRPTTTPALAGGRVVARMAVTRDDTGTAIRSGVVTCSARIGSRHLRSRTGRFLERQAQCVFDVPAGTRDRTLHGSISVSRGMLKARRSFVRPIR